MQVSEAVRVAVDILQAPSRVAYVRAGALPAGVGEVLEIAAGEDAVIERTALEGGRPRELIVDAAAFFVEQVMLAPDADSYRVLGGTAASPAAELRRNMALLMRWLHPDRSNGQERSVFAARIARAWDDVKTDERRRAYDQARQAQSTGAAGAPGPRGKRRRARPGGPLVVKRERPVRGGGLWSRLFAFLHPPGRGR